MTRRRLTEEEITADIEQFLYNDNSDNDNDSDEGDDLDNSYGDEAISSDGDDDYYDINVGVGDINEVDDVEEEIVAPVRQRRPKKILTANRLVIIDKALDLDNYDPLDLPDANFETLTGYLGPKSKATTEKIFWTNELYTHVGRQRACDVITDNVSTICRNTKRADSIRDAFELFMDEDMITLIVHKT